MSTEEQRAKWRAIANQRRAADPEHFRALEKKRRDRATPEQRRLRTDAVKRWQRDHPAEHSAYVNAYQTKRRKTDPEYAAHVRRQAQKWRLKAKYGLAIEDYDALLEAQGGVCAICHRPETMIIKGTVCLLAVDHDAGTGRIRGLLCVNCNMLIGGARHDPAILRAAIAYLA